MKIICKQNFLGNDVMGFPGKILSNEEYEAIKNDLNVFIEGGLIQIEDGSPVPSPATPEAEPDDGGMGPGEDLVPPAPIMENAAPKAELKPARKKRQ